MKESPYDAARKNHWRTLSKALLANLNAREFRAVYADTKEEALKIVCDLIPPGSSVGVPGSVTIREIGAMEALEDRGCSVIHHWTSFDTDDERLQRLQDELLADYFLTGANALTLDGMLVSIDGNGNRVSGMAWGKNTLIFVVGMNKVVAGIDEALSRTRNIATPPNALRLNLETPCAKAGHCVDCSSEARVCRALLILERAASGRETHVVLVGEDLGF